MEVIRHGVKAEGKTVPTPIRILQTQIDDLKVIVGMEGTNVSTVMRELIAEYIERKRAVPEIRAALEWASRNRP